MSGKKFAFSGKPVGWPNKPVAHVSFKMNIIRVNIHFQLAISFHKILEMCLPEGKPGLN